MTQLRHHDAQYHTKTGKRTRHNCDRACFLRLTKRTEVGSNKIRDAFVIVQADDLQKQSENKAEGETYTSSENRESLEHIQ